jgi:glutamyl-tRNA synthetase
MVPRTVMTPIAFNSHTPLRGRLAPSPTGHLHLGNAWSFLLCWLAVRSAGGSLVLRMEDIDPERSRPHFAEDIMRDLAWLGLDWDEGPDVGGPFAPYTQAARRDRYAEVIDHLTGLGRTYPCYCTRKELKTMASAPHLEDVGPVYPGTCLGLGPAERREREAQGRRPTLRLHGEGDVRFEDLVHGEVQMSWAECGGDFPLRRSDGVIAYQLAVAVDDMDQGISLVVRGADILPCTPRQILLFRLLNAPVPRYAHVPLLLDHNGERLAKRHQSCELRVLREKGVSPQAVVGYLGYGRGCCRRRPEPLPESSWLLSRGGESRDVPWFLERTLRSRCRGCCKIIYFNR